MDYKMTVTLTNPNTKDGMAIKFYELTCSFACDEKQYGNGHYVSIQGKGFDRQIYDLRYDKTFDRNNKQKWLYEWAKNYWTGKNGAYAIKELKITHA